MQRKNKTENLPNSSKDRTVSESKFVQSTNYFGILSG